MTIKEENGKFCVYDGDTKVDSFDTHDAAQAYIDHEKQDAPTKSDDDDMLVIMGGAVKAMPDGIVEGYLVQFDGVDREGDYFHKMTEFGKAKELSMMYHHGFSKEFGRAIIGDASIKTDDVGIYIRGKLNMRDQKERKVWSDAQEGKLGWSSGAAPHAVVRTLTKRGNRIDQWLLAEASLTPKPAMPSNRAIAVKSLDLDTADESRLLDQQIDVVEVGALIGAAIYQAMKK